MTQILDILLHLDVHLVQWIDVLGPWIYILMFVILFSETGLVVTPFLPGDSLLFALGALTVSENSKLSFPILIFSLIAAAILGNTVNYWIGRSCGEWLLLKNQKTVVLRPESLQKTQDFYQRHGGKAVVLARFLPIFRTFVPFLAGIGRMDFRLYTAYNAIGSLAWVGSLLTLGHVFGDLPSVKSHFHFVVLGIIAVSLLPMVVTTMSHRFQTKRS